jgi:hypothetical protein
MNEAIMRKCRESIEVEGEFSHVHAEVRRM